MHWKTIRLELARTRDFPTGSVSRGYLLRVPLDRHGLIDELGVAATPRKATIRRFWSTEPDESGQIVHVDGHWALRCQGRPDRLLLSNKPFGLGNEIAVIDSDGAPLPFRVASISRLD